MQVFSIKYQHCYLHGQRNFYFSSIESCKLSEAYIQQSIQYRCAVQPFKLTLFQCTLHVSSNFEYGFLADASVDVQQLPTPLLPPNSYVYVQSVYPICSLLLDIFFCFNYSLIITAKLIFYYYPVKLFVIFSTFTESHFKKVSLVSFREVCYLYIYIPPEAQPPGLRQLDKSILYVVSQNS